METTSDSDNSHSCKALTLYVSQSKNEPSETLFDNHALRIFEKEKPLEVVDILEEIFHAFSVALRTLRIPSLNVRLSQNA